MLAKRLAASIVLIPVFLAFTGVGGLPFTLFITLGLGVAAWEFSRLMRIAGYPPATFLVVGGTVALLLQRAFFNFAGSDWALAFLILFSMAYHLVRYEQGDDRAPLNFMVTLGGILYLGWLGGYFLSLRMLPDGKWWFLTVLPGVWIADAGAFLIGRRFGKHPLAPRLSPHKSWEGYLAGVISGVLGNAGLAALWHIADPQVTVLHGAMMGLLLGILSPLGDLGESMIKRLSGEKDSSQIIPGHGGIFDRVDSWLWGVVIGYYVVIWLFR